MPQNFLACDRDQEMLLHGGPLSIDVAEEYEVSKDAARVARRGSRLPLRDRIRGPRARLLPLASRRPQPDHLAARARRRHIQVGDRWLGRSTYRPARSASS